MQQSNQNLSNSLILQKIGKKMMKCFKIWVICIDLNFKQC